jgi:hypothetical protein
LFVLFLLAIVLSVLRFKDSDYTFDIFKLFLTHSKSFFISGKGNSYFDLDIYTCVVAQILKISLVQPSGGTILLNSPVLNLGVGTIKVLLA